MNTVLPSQTQSITFGHSPDPDDAFMFYGIAHGLIPTGPYRIKHHIEDIESLNQRALRGELEATAVSVHAYAYLSDKYAVMPCGASIGENYGPLVVSSRPFHPGELRGKKIAIPGKYTTAALVLGLVEKDYQSVLLPFDKILEAVAQGAVDAGVIIHEGQLTYGRYQLHKVLDLGQWWYQETGLPLPLGVDVLRCDLGAQALSDITKIFRNSIVHALANREAALAYAMQYGRGLDQKLTDQFVGMYVNDYTVDCGVAGRRGIEALLARGHEAGILPHPVTIHWSEDPAARDADDFKGLE